MYLVNKYLSRSGVNKDFTEVNFEMLHPEYQEASNGNKDDAKIITIQCEVESKLVFPQKHRHQSKTITLNLSCAS